MDDFMRERFFECVGRAFKFSANWKREVALGWHAILTGLYEKRPGREYHNGDHVRDLLRRLDEVKRGWGTMRRLPSDQPSWECAELAIWFHDAIYAAGTKGCEAESGRLAWDFLTSLGGESAVVSRRDLLDAITLTTHGRYEEGLGGTVRIVLDLDLAGFADPWEVFEGRNAEIRKEFVHVPDEAYAWGRLKFLAGLMSRSAIYYTLADLEAPARANITIHMADLARGRVRALGDDGSA